MSTCGFIFMLAVAALMIGCLITACRNDPDNCEHLWRTYPWKIKCLKCGTEEY